MATHSSRRLGPFATAILVAVGLFLTAPAPSDAKNPGQGTNPALTQAIDQVAKLVAQNPGMGQRRLEMVLLLLLEDLIRMEEHRHHHHHRHGFGQGMAAVLNGAAPQVGAVQGGAGALAGQHKHRKQHAGRNAQGGFGKGMVEIIVIKGNGQVGKCAGKKAGAQKAGAGALVGQQKQQGRRAQQGGFGNGLVNVAGNLAGPKRNQVARVGGPGAAAGRCKGGHAGAKGHSGKR
jgi:hypothetical protein